LHRCRTRTDEGQPGVTYGLGKISILSQETVAGMNRFAFSLFRGRDNRVDVEITLGRSGWADKAGFVRHAHMHGARVDLGENGHRRDPEIATGTNDADCDLTTICD